MKTVIKLLKAELKEWRAEYKSEKAFWRGEENTKQAIRNFKRCTTHISELEQAIKILQNNDKK